LPEGCKQKEGGLNFKQKTFGEQRERYKQKKGKEQGERERERKFSISRSNQRNAKQRNNKKGAELKAGASGPLGCR